jgi:hypothetical protein
MKYLNICTFAVIFAVSEAHAQDFLQEQRGSGAQALIHNPHLDAREIQGRLHTPNKGNIDKQEMYDYLTDDCNYVDPNVTNEEELRTRNLRRCLDGTVSFVQPNSEGRWGQEGKCGQTASSNLLYMHCRLAAHPKRYADHYLSDITPGVRPGTLEGGLEDMFGENASHCPRGEWTILDARSSREYYKDIENSLTARYNHENVLMRTRKDGNKVARSPVAALIRLPGSRDLHWVTIVDLIDRNRSSCKVVINHWDDQFEVPCFTFAKWSYGVSDSYGTLLSGYIIIAFD